MVRVHAFPLMTVEQRQVAADHRSSQLTWSVSSRVGYYHLHSLSPFSITQPKS